MNINTNTLYHLNDLPGEVWIENVLPCLEQKDIKAMQRVSKLYCDHVIKAHDYWTNEAEKQGVALPEYLTPIALIPSMLKGTMITDHDDLDRWSDHYLSGSFDYPLIRMKSFSLVICEEQESKFSFTRDQQDRIRERFGLSGVKKYKQSPEEYLKIKKVADRLKSYSKVRSDFPNLIPLRYVVSRQVGDVVCFKWDKQIYKLTIGPDTAKNIETVISCSSESRLRRYLIDSSFKETFVDLDKEIDTDFIRNNQ